jgi:hypothetical protein
MNRGGGGEDGAPRFARRRLLVRRVFPAAEHEVGLSERGPIASPRIGWRPGLLPFGKH